MFIQKSFVSKAMVSTATYAYNIIFKVFNLLITFKKTTNKQVGFSLHVPIDATIEYLLKAPQMKLCFAYSSYLLLANRSGPTHFSFPFYSTLGVQ